MASQDIKKSIKKERTRNYLGRDMDGFRRDLLRYARTYFPDKISDFSEASLGGLLLDMNAYVGDTLSFYLDHQFNELDPTTAVEPANIQRHLQNAGVPVVGASPATATVKIFIEVPASPGGEDADGNSAALSVSLLPTIKSGTVFRGTNGVKYTLTEDVDFSEYVYGGSLLTGPYLYTIERIIRSGSTPTSLILSREATCVSGEQVTQRFSIPDTVVPFRKITLSRPNVTEIVSITDTEGNEYYEVESLTQDVVFRTVLNTGVDRSLVKSNLEVIPAPYRFVKQVDLQSRIASIVFGSGDAETLDDDVIPDPSDLALPLYGRTTFSRFSIDPNSLLQTQSLGVSPRNTTITVVYRHGGGANHNIASGGIKTVATLDIEFNNPGSESVSNYADLARGVRASIDVRNELAASGGDRAPTIQELREKISSSRSAQSRVVTTTDLLARAYSIPSQFGRVYRAGVRNNPNNPLAAELFIISRDARGRLTPSPDSLKQNLRTYLNEFRLISDAIDILDVRVVNYAVKFRVVVDPRLNKQGVVRAVILRLQNVLKIDRYQVDQPIVKDDLVNVIINTQGVISLDALEIENKFGTYQGRSYSGEPYGMAGFKDRGIITGPAGSIFELRYPNSDILGSAI